MFSEDISILSSKFFNFEYKMDFPLDFKNNQDIENRFNKNFFSQSEIEEEEINLINDDTNTINSSIFSISQMMPLIENNDEKKFDNSSIENNKISTDSIDNSYSSENKEEKKFYFEVIYPKDKNLFTPITCDDIFEKQEEYFLKRKRMQIRRQRKDNQDNIRKKIRRGFLNNALIDKLNKILYNYGSKKYFEKFPQKFVSDIDKKRNKKIFSMTLRDIFLKYELYIKDMKNGLHNYFNNVKLLQSEEINENREIKNILNKTIGELYKEYLNSKEFVIDEINRLKERKMNDDYINRYIYIANHLIEFFSN